MTWTNHFWTEHEEAELKRRWKAGQSSSVIATALGCSRNAVLGKLNRLGMLGNLSATELSRRMSDRNNQYWSQRDRRQQQSTRAKAWWAKKRIEWAKMDGRS